jgi:hypothetical protein
MRFKTLSTVIAAFALFLSGVALMAQETTGGLTGTVKDATGAVVSKALVTATAPSLTGSKTFTTDASGTYRFSNLPPDTYTVTVTAKGFSTVKREGVVIETGHLPTLDLTLAVGGESTVVEVSGSAPVIDTTTNTTQTNITEDVVQDVPHGRSFQSVIQFAPSARNEPLEGSNRASNGTGGVSPGNGSNGNPYGFSVAGGSDSENSYLVEGQETANLIGGYSHTNVPFDFIDEVQIKSSGIEAEHGGALGGVVNVIMKKGSNAFHGSLFAQFENDALDGQQQATSRYDPLSSGTPTSWGFIDPDYQNIQPIKPKTSDVFPGFTFGGPLIKDKVFFFVGFNPEWNDTERTVNYGPTNGGETKFSQNIQTYYTTARIDASLTSKIRVYASWLYQYQRETGENLPASDNTSGYFNSATGCFGSATSASNPCISTGTPQFAFAHNLGYSAPNSTTNVGADITITPRLVSTTRFGYYFENYHDFGFPTNGELYFFETSGIGATDTLGNPLPASLQQSAGYYNAAQNQNDTQRNANKAIQFDQDVAWFKTGWWGTHNFKFGYQLNRLSNDLSQHWNEPATLLYVGDTPGATNYSYQGSVGQANCAPFVALYGDCQGQYGYAEVEDFGSLGKATSFNHGLFAQDSWTIARGVTINAGVRFDKEYLPGEAQGTGAISKPINFSWTDKVAPRIGAAWDVFQNGKAKIFGSYGEFYDIMKLNLAISSFGGQYWQNCYYALDTSDYTSIDPAFNASGRYCGGPNTNSATQANFAGGTTPAGLTFLENQNFRAFPSTCSTCSTVQEGVAPGLKPYKQHESVFGVDYQVAKNLAFEARWDRRRLDHVIEDSAIYNPNVGETFVIVNPGQGTNRTFSSFYNFLYPPSAGGPLVCTATDPCPPNNIIPGARSYDGVEFRLTKSISQHWFGMFSYTYSRLRGNYTGLTSSDIADGGLGGRNSPNNSRSFDEPYFSWNADGGSSSGPLPTDRPNTFKGYAYYELPWGKLSSKSTTDFGIFQYLYSGAPTTSYTDVGYGGSAWPVDLVNRGKWIDVSQDPTTGVISVGNPRTYRTPEYMQTDFNFQQNYKISEQKALSFSATFSNLLNQRAVTARNGQIDTGYGFMGITPTGNGCGFALGAGAGAYPCFIAAGQAFYAAAEAPYSISQGLNSSLFTAGPQTLNSQYGKPLYYQQTRTIRLGVKFTF